MRILQAAAILILLLNSLKAAEVPDDAKPNRLVNEQSPYLLQHAYNPVDWYPWGNEAFEKALAENKLVLVSIGYSTCHWCHVMNRESFSDPEIAQYLNDNYICIKVDREERPDIDGVYMNFVQALTGSGGWPLNVWLTPEKKPFFGGTYFPPRSSPRTRATGFIEVLTHLQSTWEQDDVEIRNRGEKIVQSLNARATAAGNTEGDLSLEAISKAIAAFHYSFDGRYAGFGKSQKFPSPANLTFLLRAGRTPEVHPEDRQLAQDLALKTLDAIANGGIRDHVGGGFHRYTVDVEWQLPHFEKMLYDQAQLARAYIDAWQTTGDERYKAIAIETLDYLLRDMRHEGGAFFSAEDAESLDPDHPEEKREGAFYTWSTEDINQLIADDKQRAFVKSYFSIYPEGNAPSGNFPTEELDGYNVLRVETELAQLAAESDVSDEDAKRWIQEAKELLFKESRARARPYLDDKIITAWNGLAISAFARAAQAFERPDYAEVAATAATFLTNHLWDRKTHRLSRLYRNGVSPVKGFSEDYSFLIEGLIDLYEATADHQWLRYADQLQKKQVELFYDPEGGAFYSFEKTDDIIFDPSKAVFDGALPTSSSVAAKNLSRLAQYFDNSAYSAYASQTCSYFASTLELSRASLPALLEALIYVAKKPLQIVIAGDPKSESVKSMLRLVNQQLLPNRNIIYADEAEGQAFLAQRLEFIKSVASLDGQAMAYVCENYVCQLPTEKLDVLEKQLADRFD